MIIWRTPPSCMRAHLFLRCFCFADRVMLSREWWPPRGRPTRAQPTANGAPPRAVPTCVARRGARIVQTHRKNTIMEVQVFLQQSASSHTYIRRHDPRAAPRRGARRRRARRARNESRDEPTRKAEKRLLTVCTTSYAPHAPRPGERPRDVNRSTNSRQVN